MTTWTAGRIAHEWQQGFDAAAKHEASLRATIDDLQAVVADLRRQVAQANVAPIVQVAVQWRTDTPPPLTRLVCVVAGRICVCTYRQRANGDGQWFDERGLPVAVEKWTEVLP